MQELDRDEIEQDAERAGEVVLGVAGRAGMMADGELRERTAEAGKRYSESCGGEPELRQRVLDRALEKLT